jgi:hypothetical protein
MTFVRSQCICVTSSRDGSFGTVALTSSIASRTCSHYHVSNLGNHARAASGGEAAMYMAKASAAQFGGDRIAPQLSESTWYYRAVDSFDEGEICRAFSWFEFSNGITGRVDILERCLVLFL